MKTLAHLLLLTLALTGCKKDAPEAGLPPATQEGRNIGACRIDGQVWQTSYSQGTAISSSGVSALVVKRASQSTYEVSINLSSGNPSRYIKLDCKSTPGYGTCYFNTTLPSSAALLPSHALYQNRTGSGPRGEFTTNASANGQLDVTYFNLDNHTIAGRFSFVAQDSLSQRRVSITDGRFDIQFVYLELP
ncbi:hypothetical protein GCM10023185_38490 [Hymenobacter saemangeumensis]|uniref:Lipoprotein n=1 Tax=Hymenobacter saemangeumensis TaxID=1084522 RepID=A0ABP8IQK6_9BACT